MKIRYFEITAILLVQAIATAPAQAQSWARNVEVKGDGECQYAPSQHVRHAQEEKIYKWTDEDGNVHFSENPPSEYANCQKSVLQDKYYRSKEQQRRSDLTLFMTQAGDMEWYVRMELYAQKLRKQLDRLETAADSTMFDESLLEDIRDAKEAIEWFEKYRESYRQKELERYQDPIEKSELGYSQRPG